MKLKYYLFVYLLIGITSLSFSQKDNPTYDSRLLAKYSSEYLEKLQTENPDHLSYLNFNIRNSFQIRDIINDNDIQFKMLIRVDSITKQEIMVTTLDNIDENFNPYLYNCELGNQQPVYYKIGNTGKMIVMESQASLKTKFKNYKSGIR